MFVNVPQPFCGLIHALHYMSSNSNQNDELIT